MENLIFLYFSFYLSSLHYLFLFLGITISQGLELGLQRVKQTENYFNINHFIFINSPRTSKSSGGGSIDL